MPVTTIDAQCALIVIDLQKGVADLPTVRPIGDVVARANDLSSAFRHHALPVVLVTVDGGPPGRVDRARPRSELPSDFSLLLADLSQEPGDLRVTKRTRSAFVGTALEDLLRPLDVTQLVLCGVSTSNGVEATARHAFDLGFNVAFAVDAMTDVSADAEAHTVATIFPKIGEVSTTAELIKLLDGSRERLR